MKEMWRRPCRSRTTFLGDYIERLWPTSPSSSCWRNVTLAHPTARPCPDSQPCPSTYLCTTPCAGHAPGEPKRRKLSPWDVHLHAHRSCPSSLARPP